ncbi:hypothetical protein ACMC9I_09475 [Deinococcota bacterium DY0809b]
MKLVALVVVLAAAGLACASSGPVKVGGMVVVRAADPMADDIRPEGAWVEVLSDDGRLLARTATGRVGQYGLTLENAAPGDELYVRARLKVAGVGLTTGRRVGVDERGYAYVPDLSFVNLSDAELSWSGSSWRSEAGEVEIRAPAGSFAQVWARALDPEFDRAFFPGRYKDADGYRSLGFLFVAARGDSVQGMGPLVEPVTVFFVLPSTHRYYLRDARPGNGSYDVPMYFFDEDRGIWVQGTLGVLLDAERRPVPETEEARVTADLTGRYYVRFQAARLSLWNARGKLPPCPEE